jgi:hypothetical protein
MPFRMPMADTNYHNVAPLNCYRRSLSLSNLNMAGLNFQTEAEVGVVPDADRAFDQRWIAEDTEQQQTHTHACFQDKVRGSGSSDSSSDSATSVQPVSPRTMYADPRTATTSSKPHDPSSVVDADADGFSPDLWVISPEERALVMVAAVVVLLFSTLLWSFTILHCRRPTLYPLHLPVLFRLLTLVTLAMMMMILSLPLPLFLTLTEHLLVVVYSARSLPPSVKMLVLSSYPVFFVA